MCVLGTLGFQLGKFFNMGCHITTVCEKARRVARAYTCLLPNVRGPSLKKKSMINAILSIIFYGIQIWHEGMKLKKNVKNCQTNDKRWGLSNYLSAAGIGRALILPVSLWKSSIVDPWRGMIKRGNEGQVNLFNILESILMQYTDTWTSIHHTISNWTIDMDFLDWQESTLWLAN